MPDRHIFLIGMQGCGKSSLGKRVARETGIPFADTDAIVARSIGGTVNDFFAQYGEEQFRRFADTILPCELEEADVNRMVLS